MAGVPDITQYLEGVQSPAGGICSQGFTRIPEEFAVQRRRADRHDGRHAVPSKASGEAYAF